VLLREGGTKEEAQVLGDKKKYHTHFDKAVADTLDYTHSLTTSVHIPHDIYHSFQSHYNPQEVVEITMVAAAYNMVSRFLVALGIQPEEGAERPVFPLVVKSS